MNSRVSSSSRTIWASTPRTIPLDEQTAIAGGEAEAGMKQRGPSSTPMPASAPRRQPWAAAATSSADTSAVMTSRGRRLRGWRGLAMGHLRLIIMVGYHRVTVTQGADTQ